MLERVKDPSKGRGYTLDEKNSKTYYGYKNYIQVDTKHKFIRDCALTNAAVHDSQVFE